MTEGDGKPVFPLVQIQLLERVLIGSFENRLYRSEANPNWGQDAVKPLQSGKAILVTTRTPVLKRKQDLHTRTEI